MIPAFAGRGLKRLTIKVPAFAGKAILVGFSNSESGLMETALIEMARATGLEPATSSVTGKRSNRLNYARFSETGNRKPEIRSAN